MMKRWLLIAALLAVVVVPAMGQSGLINLEFDQSTPNTPKSTNVGQDVSRYRVSVGDELLKVGSPAVGYGSYFLIDGPSTEPDTIWYLEPLYKINGKVLKGRVTELTITTKQILGDTHPYLAISDEDIFKLVVSYDNPREPECDMYHNGNPIFHGQLRQIGAYLIDAYLLKEVMQTVACLTWNHTIGLGGLGVVPGWCVNMPWKMADELGELELETGGQKSSLKPLKGWARLPLEADRLVTLQWGITYKVKVDGKWVVIHNTGILDFDADGDKKPNWWEIQNGYNPFDPNSPGNPTTLAEVPCMPNGAHWDLEDAQNALIDADLAVGDVLHEPSSLAAGCFIRFMPVCGSQIPRGTEVNIVISSGPVDNTVEIPCYVIGDPYNAYDEELMNRLLAAGFLAGNIHRHVIYCPGSLDVGDVGDWQAADCWQTYKWSWQCGDRGVPATAQLHYWVKGCLPCFQTGCDAEDVISQFQSAGFMVVVAEQFHPTIPAGRLISYTPECGDEVTDCMASVCVSKGPQTPTTTTVPSVLDKTTTEATSILTPAHLVLGSVTHSNSSTVPKDKIISQAPVAGSQVAYGSSVNVVVSDGPQNPDVLSASFTSPSNDSAFSSGTLVDFRLNIVNGTPPFTVKILVETGPVPGWQESETNSRNPLWRMNLNSTAQPGPSHAHAYAQVTDSLGATTPVFSVSYTVD